ncbi:hypothetical protein CVS47_00486 [Microbacterium lemovicicum]|uniref:Uncharacterized protein n=1 Tax=Microbacterium lemovicicum TaxID=1072463 RepID=A0A3Q9IWI2_9MICO|nr:hypothetical protein [Microbacterium lemovicicum]AZS35888.1 hypothetical protein CVS47_00486 [Microbacterium lemovicicum]
MVNSAVQESALSKGAGLVDLVVEDGSAIVLRNHSLHDLTVLVSFVTNARGRNPEEARARVESTTGGGPNGEGHVPRISSDDDERDAYRTVWRDEFGMRTAISGDYICTRFGSVTVSLSAGSRFAFHVGAGPTTVVAGVAALGLGTDDDVALSPISDGPVAVIAAAIEPLSR